MRRSKDDIFVQPKYSTNHDLGDTFMQLADLFVSDRATGVEVHQNVEGSTRTMSLGSHSLRASLVGK